MLSPTRPSCADTRPLRHPSCCTVFDRERLSEQECPYQDCRQWLEDSEDGGLRGADIAGRYRKREQGDHRRDDGEADNPAIYENKCLIFII